MFLSIFSRRYYQSMTEKIVQHYVINNNSYNNDSNNEDFIEIKSGNYVTISPNYIMTHDNTAAVIPKFNLFYNKKSNASVFNNKQIVFCLDHNVQDKSEANLKKYNNIQSFAKQHNIDFYPAGRGIGHQIMCEEGYAYPGTLVVASDSHSNMYGAIGCLGTPIVRTDAASIWACGKTWWQVPPLAKVVLKGKLKPGCSGKDVIVALCGLFKDDEVLNHSVEFVGDGVETLSMSERMTISNMSTEWGALVGLFPIDNVTIDYLKSRADYYKKLGVDHPRHNAANIKQLEDYAPKLAADPKALYDIKLELDLSQVEPCVAGPNDVKIVQSAAALQKKKIAIQKAYLVSCVNSRVDDLAEAAKVLKGKKVANSVEFYIAAASSQVMEESKARGDWKSLLEAGAIELPPGCGPCIGLGTGLLKDGEVGISATNRNFKGRMGSPNSFAYLASPAVVAMSAHTGFISSPQIVENKPLIKIVQKKVKSVAKKSSTTVLAPLVAGFPEFINGKFVFCHQDNLNTDGIYPGKYTYNESITPEEQAKVAMENYDKNFSICANKGDILVGGYNFGTGSSREQAATALKYKGLSLVIAGSFSETYKRNAINNGLLCIECPSLVDYLKTKFGTTKPTVKSLINGSVNFQVSQIDFDEKIFPIGEVGVAAQEMIIAGGQQEFVVNQLKKMGKL